MLLMESRGIIPKSFLRTFTELITSKTARAIDHLHQSDPAWIPRNCKDSTGHLSSC